MNWTRSSNSVRILLLAVLVAGLSPSLASAQEFHGTFTLPFEANWGPATLPAGEYSFILDHRKLEATVLVSGKRQRLIVLPQMIEHRTFPGNSALIVVRHDDKCQVRALYIAQMGLFLDYYTPKGGERLVAQGPVLIQRIPVARVGK
jgi:hypothetical protein